MPIYEYGCEACGHRFERWQRITEAPLDTCEGCGQPRARRLISTTSFQLKGSGWYASDYGGKGRSSSKSDGA